MLQQRPRPGPGRQGGLEVDRAHGRHRVVAGGGHGAPRLLPPRPRLAVRRGQPRLASAGGRGGGRGVGGLPCHAPAPVVRPATRAGRELGPGVRPAGGGAGGVAAGGGAEGGVGAEAGVELQVGVLVVQTLAGHGAVLVVVGVAGVEAAGRHGGRGRAGAWPGWLREHGEGVVVGDHDGAGSAHQPGLCVTVGC